MLMLKVYILLLYFINSLLFLYVFIIRNYSNKNDLSLDQIFILKINIMFLSKDIVNYEMEFSKEISEEIFLHLL